MRIRVDDVSLFVDIDGAGLVADGPAMRSRPALVLLHGGPGLDHSMFKPDFRALRDVAQLIYVDLRGNGRSDAGTPDGWTLARWGDDVAALCEALGVERPAVLGLSWGGFVAQAFAVRHPARVGQLILESTAARWPGEAERPALMAAQAALAAGQAVPGVSERPDLGGSGRRRVDADAASRYVRRPEVAQHFFAGEAQAMDFRPRLAAVGCPALVLAGDHDPTLPLPLALELAAALPHAALHVFHGCGHGVHVDAPARTMEVVGAFLAG